MMKTRSSGTGAFLASGGLVFLASRRTRDARRPDRQHTTWSSFRVPRLTEATRPRVSGWGV